MAGKAPTAAGVVLYLALAGSANSKKNRGGQKMTLAFRTLCSAQKKEDRLRGKVDLLLRRKEIRVVLLALCKSNKHATVSFFVFLLIFAGFMGLSGGANKEAREGGSTNFLTLVAEQRSCFLFYAVVSLDYMGLFFLYQHVEGVFWRED
ncbi:MAG: hypothetical protein ACYDIB_07140 [Desulfobulbia bacterium]